MQGSGDIHADTAILAYVPRSKQVLVLHMPTQKGVDSEQIGHIWHLIGLGIAEDLFRPAKSRALTDY